MSEKLTLKVEGTEYEWDAKKVGAVDPPDPVDPVEPTTLTKRQRIGVDTFWWGPDRTTHLKDTFGLERLYIGTGWVWRTGELLTTEPSHQADGMLDSYLRDAKALSKTIVPCFSWKPEWMADQGKNDWANGRLCDYGTTGNKPTDYYSAANFAFQIGARYGKKAWPENALRVNTVSRWNGDPANQKLSGLDLLEYVSFENETNRWWKTDDCKYTPAQLAAFMSAVWDGDQGRMGKAGLKAATDSIKMVLPGLAFMDQDYLTEYKKEILKIRTDGSLCIDVVDAHHYCNSDNAEQRVNVSGIGISPQEDNFKGRVEKFVAFCKTNFPNLPIWLSEFGWDTEGTSTQRAPGEGIEQERTQGAWIVEAYEIGLAAGLERMFLYELFDQQYEGNGLFQRSGLLKQSKLGYAKKMSFDMVAAYINKPYL